MVRIARLRIRTRPRMICLKYFVRASRPNDLENSGMSEPADYNWTLMDLDGQAVFHSPAKFKGQDRVPQYLGDLVQDPV